MSFVSIPFLFFFLPLCVGGYFLLGLIKKRAVQNIWLLIASLVFLVWLEPLIFPLICILTLSGYVFGRILKSAQWEGKPTKRYIVICCVLHGGVFLVLQGLLAYTNNGGSVMGLEYSLFRNLALPAGIALFTLRSIAYVDDIYTKKTTADTNFLNVALYLLFFPLIIIGPLSSYQEFRPQLVERTFNAELLYNGVCRFIVGLGKKVIIAGNLAVVSDEVFRLSAGSDSLAVVPVTLAWLGLFVFCLQIFFDFSAYSDMAIGLCGVFGFSVPENFNYPYMAKSMTDFWKRWLITIKDWFDRYVTQPLNKKRSANNDQMVVNVFISFVAMGIWHRLSIGILVWALLQVFCIMFERVITYDQRKIPRIIQHGYVIVIVMLSFVFLRSENMYETLLFLRNLIGMNQSGFFSPLALTFVMEYGVFIVLALVFVFPLAPALRKRVEKATGALKVICTITYPVLMIGVLYVCMMYLSRGLYVPVPYFGL